MREIKFRGIRLDNGRWAFGDISQNTAEGKVYMAGCSNETMGGISQLLFDINIETVGQFTGLKDKNGLEIYEGDKVRILYTDWPSKSENDPRTLNQYLNDIAKIGTVEFEHCKFGIRFNPDFDLKSIFPGKHGFIEVIGKIYEK